MEIYTIGHSNYAVEKLIHMLKHYNINCVVDIRGIPYSKYNIQYNKETIAGTLKEAGFLYIYMAKEFAANRENKRSYNKEGYSDFEKVITEIEFLNGIERLKKGCEKGYRIALLGAMQDPIRCHRSILVGRALSNEGFNVKHILDDYTVATQKMIEENLLNKFFSNRNQITIDNLLGVSLNEVEMVKQGYRLANKEIGYRVEHLQ
ncbi:uncharacterized protein (DUF488 family) [Clostridium saccharoperbutylacetonicum]|uniref:DUF488 domain-containing protein n=1 Tax=Clostridium saccharoperbutylacetonicum N1-4(HMT) TaxID=931276 RepID=M1MEH4_9CLOT|nr:DUF488 domain-containing protein [Clostridium saccharoperbutylacetonicum]AGF56314.1 hypothetical protein Cspa_c25490 [Clostridium saccharoperbutylacetonicum N1-4(HMT)]NRT62942.1 uncharacterized protein (DUF488 family) [Clostridium saccharoperbutylacetonicum]NSB26299.1 uncharacterized protein (DUF488 family) [Clostridium saccharoperbutylacetonicum]NSB45650.1 uncharacterized protein (DUF488 family) [Clostridium saccharoperbutylacetonicum]